MPKRADYFLCLYTILTFLMFLAVFVGGVAAYRQLQSLNQQAAAAERNLRFQIYRDLLTIVDEFETERHRIERHFPADTSNVNFESLKEDQQELLEQVCRSFDKLGMMVAKGVVPLSFILDFHTRGLVVIWHRLRPFVEQLRKQRNQPGHMKQFQMLAIEAKEHRDNDPDKRYQGEETFVLSSEDKKEWTKWHERFWPNLWM